MELRHPIDEEIRGKLRALGPHQTALARQIGRSTSWLNKYMNGAGTATIDDVVRIAAALIGFQSEALTDAERRLLKAYRGMRDDRQDDAVALVQTMARANPREQHQELDAPPAHTSQAGARKGRGKQRAESG
jgi:transcriptional regulator with XRE-family HTH domain